MKTALFLAALLNTAGADPYATPRACLEDVDGVVDSLSLPGIEVNVEYRVCGMVNAGYNADGHRLLVCTELLDLDAGMIRFVIAHEMAHAIIDQWHIPVPASEEAAADELAAVAFVMTGHTADVQAAANWYTDNPDDGEDVSDDHPSNEKRAAVLSCLAAGSTGQAADDVCTERFRHSVGVWVKLLQTFGPK